MGAAPGGGNGPDWPGLADLCGVRLDEKDLVVALGVESIEIGLNPRSEERPGQDKPEDDRLRFSGPDPGPPCECGIMAWTFALATLETAN